MVESWNQDSETEYWQWIRSGNATEQQLKACAKLIAIMKEDIMVNGPVGLIQCRTVQRHDGETVDLYCLKRNRGIAMCFAIHGNHVHLVVWGPYNDDTPWDTAIKRTKAW